ARLVALERVEAHELPELQEVGDAAGDLERLVELLARARDADVLPELLAQPRELAEGVLEALLVAGHAAVVPHDLAELAVEGRDRAFALDAQEAFRAGNDGLLGRHDLAMIVGQFLELLAGGVVADRVGND